MKYLFFILIILVFFGCQPQEEDPGYYCSKEIPEGYCEDLDKVCHLGECISLTKKCGPSWGPLCEGQEKSHECTDKDEDNVYECTQAKCSRTYKEGYCTDDKKCISGRCKPRCSVDEPLGFCDDGKQCIQGDCISEPFCGTEMGACPNNKSCVVRAEGGYECVELCSTDFPEGRCDTGKDCVDGSCLRTERLCSVVENASDGECAGSKICVEGTDGNECVEGCSEDNPTGACRGAGEECVDNACIGVCSEEFFPNGYCPDEKQCRQGNCVNLCSATHLDGYCEDGICTNGACISECSPTNLDGYCEDGKACNENGICVDFCDPTCSGEQICILGTCHYNCSVTHVADGYCPNDEEYCMPSGECKGVCSPTELGGHCPTDKTCTDNGICLYSCAARPGGGYCPSGNICDENGDCIPTCNPACGDTQTCINNSCEDNCAFDHPDGYCENNKHCMDGDCKGECSAQELDGYCEVGKCIDGECKSGEDLPCSPENLVGFCDATHSCVAGACVFNCSVDHLDGYCADEKHCMVGICRDNCSNDEPEGYCETGECTEGSCSSSSSCSDNRPENGQPGSCCSVGQDCVPGGSNPVCADGIEGKYCYNVGAICTNDSSCSDPFSEYGTTQHYYCNRVDYIFDATSHAYLSFCEQVPDSCIATGRTKNLGENCNEECGDYECRSGNQCVNGICVIECASGNSNDCILNNTVCSPVADTYPGSYWNGTREGGVSRNYNVCKHECGGNNDCEADQRCNSLFDPSYRVFDMKSQTNPNGNPQAPFIQSCTSDLSRKIDGASCTASTECNSGICYLNKCQKLCKDDTNCDNDEYCHNLFNLQQTYYTGATDNISKLGLCLKLEEGTVRGPSCTHVSDCPDTTFTVAGRQIGYECLWRINRNSYINGVCGIRPNHSSLIYRGIGGSCDGTNNLCESGICHQGTCKSLCATTSQCPDGNLCYRAQATVNTDVLPYGVGNVYQPDSIGGVCLNLGTVTDCTTSSCGAGTTCIHNLVNDAHDAQQPWKLGIEYKCVGVNNGFSIGQSCANNGECSSYTCNMIEQKCTIACTVDSQCSGIGNEYCDTTYNIGTIENRINAGICR